MTPHPLDVCQRMEYEPGFKVLPVRIEVEEDKPAEGNLGRGILFGLAISLAMWALIGWGIWVWMPS